MKEFHVTGTCNPDRHYMVDISGRIEQITSDYIDKGKYFTINRARQYGKTTLMFLLRRYLLEKYVVISISFEAADELFVSSYALAAGLCRNVGRQLRMQDVPEDMIRKWEVPISKEFPFDDFGERISELCLQCGRKIVLMRLIKILTIRFFWDFWDCCVLNTLLRPAEWIKLFNR